MNEIHITVDDTNVRNIIAKGMTLGDTTADTVQTYTEMMASSCRLQFLSQTKLAPRTRLANRMYAKRMSKDSSAVIIPESAYQLDSMQPHYKPLIAGSDILNWARKYYIGENWTMTGARKSIVRYNARGKILGGKIWVTPDPWMQEAQNRVRPYFNDMLIDNVRKTLLGTV